MTDMITTRRLERAGDSAADVAVHPPVFHRTVTIEGVDLFYREAGDPTAPAIVLLHGFPTSSYMFRNLIPQLARTRHVIAPDYPGFGQSAMPDPATFPYTFDRMADMMRGLLDALGIDRFAIYVQDYGAPVGFRLAVAQPERIRAIVSQNGNAYEEGLTPFWEPLRAYWADPSEANAMPLRAFLERDALIWQYTDGVRDVTRISPDTWTLDQALLDRPGNAEIQLALFYDYRTNPGRYAEWQTYFREHQPPMLAVWGKNDQIFGPDGARAFARDLPDAEIHLLDTGHFALEEEGETIAELINDFLSRHDGGTTPRAS